MDRMKIRQRVADKVKDEFVKRHTLELILSNMCIELVEAMCDEMEPHLRKERK